MTTRRRFTLRSALLLLVLSLASLIGLGPAMALGPSAHLGEVPMLKQSDTYGPGIWHNAPQGKTWYGAYRTFKKTPAYCIDAGKQSPLPKYFTGAKSTPVTSAQTAWALHTYSDSKSADVHAALSALARLDENLPHDHKVPPQKPGELGKKFSGAAKKFSTITAEAKKFAGPYTLDVSLSPVLDMPVLEPYKDKSAPVPDPSPGPDDDSTKVSFPTTGEVELSISLTSASGTSVPDIPIALDTNGVKNAPKTVTSADKPTVTRLTVTTPGVIKAEASAKVAPDSVLLFEPQKTKKVQRVITPDKPAQVSAKATVDMISQPRVSTEISEENPQPGDEVTDEFTVSGLVGDHTVTVEHQLWRTATQPELGKKNDDAEVIATVTSKNIGNGTHRSEAITIAEDFRGWMYFTETIAGDAETQEWKGVHGQPGETGFTPWTPSAETEAVVEGSKVHDEVRVSGLRPGAEAVVSVTAYKSESEPKQSPEPQGEELGTQDTTIVADQDGVAEVSTEAIEMPIGWVTFVTSIEGSEVHTAWTSDWGIPAETVHRAPEETPSQPPEEPSAPLEEPSAPPEAPSTPPDEPSTPPEQPIPEQPKAPAAPPAEPVAEEPAPAQLPRTGATGNGMLIGAGVFLIGLGATTLLITGRRRSKD